VENLTSFDGFDPGLAGSREPPLAKTLEVRTSTALPFKTIEETVNRR
jgi:hypothetical protein